VTSISSDSLSGTSLQLAILIRYQRNITLNIEEKKSFTETDVLIEMSPGVKTDKLEDEVTNKQPFTDHSLGNYILHFVILPTYIFSFYELKNKCLCTIILWFSNVFQAI
jgi:hypothetical protein